MAQMIIVVGVSKSIAQRVAHEIEARENMSLPSGASIHFCEGKEGYPLYPDTHRNVIFKFIYEQIYETTQPPEILRILYMPCPTTDRLFLDDFYLIADIVSLNYHAYDKGVDHVAEIANRIFRASREGMAVQRPAKKGYKVLPPNNYKVDSNYIDAYFYDFYRKREIDESFFATALLKEVDKYGNSAYKDNRGVLFKACKVTEQHGRATVKDKYGHNLKGIYRFGWLFDGGFHHDIEHSREDNLDGYSFNCSVNGTFSATQKTSYINIYMNDFIRGKR